MIVAYVAMLCNFGFGDGAEVFVNVLQSRFKRIGYLHRFRKNLALVPVAEYSRENFQYIGSDYQFKSRSFCVPLVHYFCYKFVGIYTLELVFAENLLTGAFKQKWNNKLEFKKRVLVGIQYVREKFYADIV